MFFAVLSRDRLSGLKQKKKKNELKITLIIFRNKTSQRSSGEIPRGEYNFGKRGQQHKDPQGVNLIVYMY